MQVGLHTRLKPGAEERYEEYHRAVWPDVLKAITGKTIAQLDVDFRKYLDIRLAAYMGTFKLPTRGFDDVTIVEAVELDRARPDFFSPWCAILTFRDGLMSGERFHYDLASLLRQIGADPIPALGGLSHRATA